MLLSIIVPVFNEKDTILEVIVALERLDLDKIKKEIIVVDDGSTDGTQEVLKGVKRHKIILNKENKGKGYAVRTGFEQAEGDILVIQDADLEYNPKEIKKLLRPILEGKVKVVYGSRFLSMRAGKKRTILPLHYFGNKFLSLCTRIIYGARITDMETGYKMFRREVINDIKLESRRFDFEPEITAKILRKGYKIIEVPIEYHARDFSEGKKITWRDGFIALYYLLKFRFS